MESNMYMMNQQQYYMPQQMMPMNGGIPMNGNQHMNGHNGMNQYANNYVHQNTYVHQNQNHVVSSPLTNKTSHKIIKMSKLVSSLLVVVAVLATLNHEVNAMWSKRCPDVKPMPNIDINRNSGPWYVFAENLENLESRERQLSCFAARTTITSATTATYSMSFKFMGQFINEQVQIRLDPSQPGVEFFKANFTVRGFFGWGQQVELDKSSISLATDYDNIQLGYSCSEIPHFWGTEVKKTIAILVRDRNFDSFKKINAMVQKVAEMGFDMNTFGFINQTECTNFV